MGTQTAWEEFGIYWKFTGEIQGEDFIAANETLYKDQRFESYRYQIADLSEVTLLNASSDTIKVLGAMDSHAAKTNPNMRVAIIATQAVIKGLARMYEQSGGSDIWEVEIFETLEDARRWIAEFHLTT